MCISVLSNQTALYQRKFQDMSALRTHWQKKCISSLNNAICSDPKSLNFVKYSLECTKIM